MHRQLIIITLFFFFFAESLMAQYQCKQHGSHAIPKSIRDASNSIDLDPRIDSLDIQHYHLNLEFPSTQEIIEGYADLQIVTKIGGISQLTLDLLSLTVDSVIYAGNQLTFLQTEDKLQIWLENELADNQQFNIRIYYGGAPAQDPTGFGGFYFMQGYAFNLGVTLTEIPHPYGRAWFPCFDNFIQRSTYSFEIKTFGNNNSVCSGVLTEEMQLGDALIRKWELNQPVPTYLVSIAVGPYVFVETSYQSISSQDIPVILAAAAGDTTNMKNSFQNLEAYFHRMEENFGPYLWDRVGFVLVPFNSGALEHALNIAFPRLAANGQTTFQNVMAHELAHNWFGNLATCRVAEEMYLNEGFAVYGEFLFDEWLISPAAYATSVRNNHRNMLQFAHVKDQGYWALSNVPQEHTYGDHSYRKGADIIHTLRTYMGDEAFFNGLKFFLENNIYKDVTSDTLQYYLELSSGQNLSNFFDHWIHQEGWPHLGIDSLVVSPQGNQFNARVYYQQRLVAGNNYFQNVPMQLSFLRDDFQLQSTTVNLSGQLGFHDVLLPFNPVHAFFNRDEKISHAVTADERIFRNNNAQNLNNAYFEVIPQSVTDSTYLRVEHNWAGPGGEIEGNFRISPNRFWTVKGLSKGTFNARMRVYYNGRTSTTNTGWLDHELIDVPDNQVVLLYRANPSEKWRRLAEVNNNTFPNNTDKYGFIELSNFPFGEYVLGVSDSVLSMNEIIDPSTTAFTVFPNPAKDYINIRIDNYQQAMVLSILDLNGKEVLNEIITVKEKQINTKTLPSGVYLIRLNNPENGNSFKQKLIIR